MIVIMIYEGGNKMHGHNHVHEFLGATTYYDGHNHRYTGSSSPVYYVGNKHVHRIVIIIEIEDGHDHEIEVLTGPEIYTDRGHVHHFLGRTSRSGRTPHEHNYDDISMPPVAYFY